MRRLSTSCPVLSLLALALATVLTQSVSSQEPATDTVTATVTIIVHGPEVPPILPATLGVRQDGELRTILSLQPPGNSDNSTELVILIDGWFGRNVSNRWDELQTFLRNLPAKTLVTIAYADGKAVRIAQPASADHALAAKAIRNPESRNFQATPTFVSVQNLIQMLPARSNGRRAILLVNAGFETDAKAIGIPPENTTDVQKTIDAAQRSGVVIYSIYSKPSLTDRPEPLERLADETGGKAFFTGLEPSPSLLVPLHEISLSLGHQYVITFDAKPTANPRFAAFRVTAETRNANIRYPACVYVPAAK